MRLDFAGMDAYTNRFDTEAFRYEVLSAYDVPSDGGDVARYLAGEPGPTGGQAWRDWIRAQIQRGAAVRALRVLHEPPGDYLRFELEWGYLPNIAAGMQARVLDLTEQSAPPGFLHEEFWLLDGERVAVMRYDDAGRFLHADTVEGPAAQQYRTARDAGWAAGEPVTAWWGRHPEYHRRPLERRGA